MSFSTMISLTVFGLQLSSVTAATHTPISLATKTASAVRESSTQFTTILFVMVVGVGTYVNGLHLQLFQDSTTCKTSNFNLNCSYGFNDFTSVHNSLAYFGYINKTNPADLYTIGGRGEDGHQVFQALHGLGYFPLGPNEGSQTFIWPDSVLTLPGNKTALVDAAVLPTGPGGSGYSTLFVVDVVPPEDIPVGQSLNITRVKGVENGLFFNGSARFCDTDMILCNIFCFGASEANGIRMAKVDVTKYGDRSAYQFYNASSGHYSSTAPAVDDNTVDLIPTPAGNHIQSAQFYYSYYHQTYVCIALLDYGAVYVSYSTNGKITGKWTPLTSLVNVDSDPLCGKYKYPNLLPYYVNIFPSWYGPGSNKLLISWASCTAYVNQATITFA